MSMARGRVGGQNANPLRAVDPAKTV